MHAFGLNKSTLFCVAALVTKLQISVSDKHLLTLDIVHMQLGVCQA